ncbi:MAG: hypothetical protein ACLQOO_24020, partial [Terriglobia bacterium]
MWQTTWLVCRHLVDWSIRAACSGRITHHSERARRRLAIRSATGHDALGVIRPYPANLCRLLAVREFSCFCGDLGEAIGETIEKTTIG